MRVRGAGGSGTGRSRRARLAWNAGPRSTMRSDRARASLDRHATYTIGARMAGPPARLGPS